MEKNDMPLVSVAITTYNHKEFICESIDSVLSQSYENIEIVIADDCSSDGTQDILKEYDAEYPDKFILKLSTINQGVTKNTNLAHHACHGKYIACFSGDDVMLPGKLFSQVNIMELDNNIAICYHELEVFDSESGKTIAYWSSQSRPFEGGLTVMVKHGCFVGATPLWLGKAVLLTESLMSESLWHRIGYILFNLHTLEGKLNI